MNPQLPFLPKSRDEFPALFNAMGFRGVGVEVGTQRGHYAQQLREGWNGDTLICVDPWAPYPGMPMGADEHEACFREAQARTLVKDKKCTLLRATSVEGARLVTKSTSKLDFVYIDGDHDYIAIKKDIMAWWPLVRSGGILAGHDYVTDGWHVHGEPTVSHTEDEARDLEKLGYKLSPFYVRRAVNEFFTAESIHLTSPAHDSGWLSWFVVKT